MSLLNVTKTLNKTKMTVLYKVTDKEKAIGKMQLSKAGTSAISDQPICPHACSLCWPISV